MVSIQQSKKSADDLILAIDNGTQSIRVLIFDLKGNLLAKSQIELEIESADTPGSAQQQASYFWDKLAQSCQRLWKQPQVIEKGYQHKIVAVTLTTQRSSVVNLDKNGEALRPVMLWLDQRQATDLRSMAWYWRVLFKIIGQSRAIDYFRGKAQANWIAQNQPDIWQKTHKFLLLSGYLTYQLTGQYKDSVGCTVGYFPFDYKKQKWAKSTDWKWNALPLKPNMLAELVKPGQKLGEITPQASQLTGIPQGLPLVAAASDKACEVLGSGCFEPSTASLSYGTTATINTNNAKYIEPQVFIPSYPSAIPDQFNSEVMIYRGFWMVSWFKHQFGLKEMKQAQKLGVTAETLFDELVNQVPPGSMGLMLQPYWSPGIKNLEAKGAILGFGDVHTRAHIYRAILEGLAYALKEGKQSLEKRQGQKIKKLIVSGGGSQSDAAMQLTADIFNLSAQRPHTFETSGLGAAMNAAVGMGYYANYQQAAQSMTRIVKTFQPDPANVILYDQLFEQVYKKMYRQLKPLYQKIKKITGYPQ
ncbi:MAG: carbohydrate kinase [Gammaproteobacteria bacterium CG22_combo_CG10-13_8_21_14_all_40_8]|nr:MAG: carbohydrate kinase [Gammaproteobacteria bacterium CG22_combo_CG10-13_8_21_14_all_40_8]